MITPCNFLIYDSTIWVLDIESFFNICNSLQGLQISRRFEEGERFFNVRDRRSVPVLALRIIKLVFKSNIIILKCHFCPSFSLNIISIGLLAMHGYKILIKRDNFNIIMNNINVMNGELNNKIYILSQPVSVMYSTNKYPRISDVSDLYLWHCRLGHVNKNRINRLTQEGIFEVSDCESLPIYEFYLLGKIFQSPFIGKGE